jgi:hypothetical protein
MALQVLPKRHWSALGRKNRRGDCRFDGVAHAEVQLAIFEGQPGALSKSFLTSEHELYHGNQVLAGGLGGQTDYDSTKRFGQSSHTFENILSALTANLPTQAAAEATQQFAGYMTLDALIGNTDRHHENWGILRRPTAGGWESWLAPSFDHASSLGRELQDDQLPKKCRRWFLEQEGGIARYVERARGAIFDKVGDKHGPSPLELVRRCSTRYPAAFREALSAAAALDPTRMEKVVAGSPVGMMSDLARVFAMEMMTYSLNELRRLAP